MKKARDCLCLCLLKTFRRSFLTLQNPTPKMDLSGRYSYSPLLRWNPQVEEYFIRAYGADHFSRISKALTRPSCYSCIRVNTLKTTTDDVIQKLLAIIQNSGSSEADVASSVKGRLQNGTISESQIPGLEYVVFVKGSGPHTIDYGYEPDKPPKEVIVSRKCAEAVLRGAQVYVPGVMACSSHVEKGDVVAVSVAVEQPTLDGGWGLGITRGTVLQGSQTDVLEGEIFLQNLPSIVTAHALDPQKGERILDMCAAPGGKTTAIASLLRDEGEVVAVDRSHNKVMDIQKLAAEMGLKCITTYKLDALKAVRRKNESNDEPNMCNSKDNNYITSQTSDSMKLHKEVPSIAAEGLNGDKSCKEKVSNEKGVERTYVSKADTRKNMRRMRNGPGRNQCLGGRAENSKGFSPNSFDRVLLDAPCSALGLRPRLFAAEETIQSLRNHGKYQRRMFDQAVQLVRPGGIIVYSTCTINPGENEALVRYALDRYKFLSLAPQHPRIGGPGLVGRYEFPDGYVEEWLKPGEEELVQRFDPSSPLDTIGFFIAKFTVGPA
ncbi:rRNA (cytosine-C(5))-methyltransferase NOP2C isoform X2 [Citrus sinensis]|uniref:rRNA (cytosine-C(5))-methyltransferase NOP2C isoform X2 n=1 Tax=Citrus sinensis TaxID=2711 RepID=UPI0003D6F601|nr:rRNA (cytosine-C(5))-methyltransferase NOP2C isoform X2 [Citrus sinensis]